MRRGMESRRRAGGRRGTIVAEIRGVRKTFEVELDVTAMEREDAAEHGYGWSAASLLALCGDLIEAGRGDLVWQELKALMDVDSMRARKAAATLGEGASLVRHGISALENRAATVPTQGEPG
jgi:hypothetical protein